MKVKILTAQKKLIDEGAKEVILPGVDGEISVWDFHQPFLYVLGPGQIKVRIPVAPDRMQERRFAIKRGIAKFQANILTVMVESF